MGRQSTVLGRTYASVVALPAALVLTAGLSAGCGGGEGAERTRDELTATGGRYCPDRLPRAPEATHGFGTDESAETAPDLREPEVAWVCTYDTELVDRTSSGGAWYDWVRRGRPIELTPKTTSALSRSLGQFIPPDPEQACTSDLGPRYLVSYSSGRDLTGVVVDDYGCRSVRLTDDPFTTVPGDATQGGTLPGVLAGGAGLLDVLGLARPR